ncbi:hypothetical protein EV385_0488 [Krasilnikovia cinnamomea]|uniref:Uncharacterized protein n=1 Tax=Krasilnikovia cinnamomea TaxID=349313 RepID=A0A4Q7ZEQ0_9ACTN|nr:hypothetical protein [Krasilnikovia cinnamomea]RZU48764.1 hypothetical protein EV385_0488 [Krasilnikovia cinnamomea]
MLLGSVVLRSGLRLHLPEAHYKFGLGDIDVVVCAVGTVTLLDGEPWVLLTVDESLSDHSIRTRGLQVRVAALAAALRPSR